MTDITKDINYSKYVFRQLQRWRLARADRFKDLDILSLRALESGDTVKLASIVAEKAELRDITNYDFSTCKKLPEILEVWFPVLGNKDNYPA